MSNFYSNGIAADDNDKSKQKYIIVTVGPTGSGKTDVIKTVEKILNIDEIHQDNYILIDNLVEVDPFYKSEVHKILEKSCESNNIANCNVNGLVNNPSKELLESFEKAYFYSRKRKGCGKGIVSNETNGADRNPDNADQDQDQDADHHPDNGETCDQLNDFKFEKSLEEGKNIVFETTGEKGDTSPAAWFLTNSEWWANAYKKIQDHNYKIIIAYSLVEKSKLIERNKSRAKDSIVQFIEQIKNKKIDDPSVKAPRLPDINSIPSKFDKIINNLIVLLHKCFGGHDLGGHYSSEEYCGTYPLKNINVMVFDNSGKKGEMELIYDHDNPQHINQSKNGGGNNNSKKTTKRKSKPTKRRSKPTKGRSKPTKKRSKPQKVKTKRMTKKKM